MSVHSTRKIPCVFLHYPPSIHLHTNHNTASSVMFPFPKLRLINLHNVSWSADLSVGSAVEVVFFHTLSEGLVEGSHIFIILGQGLKLYFFSWNVEFLGLQMELFSLLEGLHHFSVRKRLRHFAANLPRFCHKLPPGHNSSKTKISLNLHRMSQSPSYG